MNLNALILMLLANCIVTLFMAYFVWKLLRKSNKP